MLVAGNGLRSDRAVKNRENPLFSQILSEMKIFLGSKIFSNHHSRIHYNIFKTSIYVTLQNTFIILYYL